RNLFVVLWVHQRADLGLRIGRQTNLDALSLSCVALHELIVDSALNQDAGTSGATLTVEGEYAEDCGIDGSFQVRIIKDYGWGLAAQFHRQEIGRASCRERGEIGVADGRVGGKG